jgi:hypothetical protein
MAYAVIKKRCGEDLQMAVDIEQTIIGEDNIFMRIL